MDLDTWMVLRLPKLSVVPITDWELYNLGYREPSQKKAMESEIDKPGISSPNLTRP